MLCVLCEKAKTSGSLEFCRSCFNKNKSEIAQKKPWVRAVKNEAQRERRRREKEYENISLDAMLEWEFGHKRGGY